MRACLSGPVVTSEWARLRRAIVADDEVAEAIGRQAVEVVRLPHGTSLAVRDPLFVIAGHVIEGSLRSIARRKEGESLRALLTSKVATVPPGSDNEVDGPYLEGGDVIVTPHEVYVGMSGNASDLAGIDWLQVLLGAERRVVPMAMRSSVRHLEDVLALVRPGLLIQCRPLLVDGLPRALRDWQSIDLMPEERADILVLDEKRVLTAASQPRLTAELRSHGVQVGTIAPVSPLGVGLRAAHAALWRE
jgi:glycine amidinotransferase